MSQKNEVVEDVDQAQKENEERQRKEQLMASTLQKMNPDDIMTQDDIDNVTKSGIVSVPRTMSIPEAITSTIIAATKQESSSESESKSDEKPEEPSQPTKSSKVFETFGNQYWD